MAIEVTKILIKPLNGSNYATWKVQCKMAVIREGLLNIVNEVEAAPAESNVNGALVAKYELRKDCALATIALSIEHSLFYLLGPDPDDPAEVWKKLANQFQKKSWAKKLALRRKLHALQLKEGQSIQTDIKTMTEIFDELAIVGDPLDNENKVVHLLASLLKSYDMLVTALEASQEVPKIDVVTEGLLHEETKQKDAVTVHEVKAMTSKHRNRKDLNVIIAENTDTYNENVSSSGKVVKRNRTERRRNRQDRKLTQQKRSQMKKLLDLLWNMY